MLDDPYVGQSFFPDLFEQATDTGCMDFHADKIQLRPAFGDCRGGLAHPETDFQNDRRRSSECFCVIERFPGKWQTICRPKFTNGAFLSCGKASGTRDETSDATCFRIEKHGFPGRMHNRLVWHNRLCHQVKRNESVILRRFEKLGNRHFRLSGVWQTHRKHVATSGMPYMDRKPCGILHGTYMDWRNQRFFV